METATLKTLEYDKIISMLTLHAGCCVSRELCESLTPCKSADEMRASLDLTAQAETVYIRSGCSPVDDFPDVRSQLKRIRAVLFLSANDLLAISRALRAIRNCRESLTRSDVGTGLLSMAHMLITCDYAEDEINRCILGEDEIADHASPELARIRKHMRLANEKIREKLNTYIHSQTYQKYLQEPLITLRNGRFVIPVKSDCRGNIPGLIHDQSGSGQTLFIEPMPVVELGNELKKLAAEEKAEIERILTGLTGLVAPCSEDIYKSLTVLGQIDVTFAKAKLAKEMRAVMPHVCENGNIRIVRGRHPLIPREKVVPLDIWLGEDFRTLIITGPNTGGKTVTLKTVGLFTLLAMSGMFVPANEGTQLSFFENVFADIGDEQSIEQSLSTFSSHMKNIVHILDRSEYNPQSSLILLDELGAGTDPVEGAALAMAILEKLSQDGCITLATTHYSEIKAFALARDGMENASMEFDVGTLSPTYRLFIGIPGKSNAFEISGKLGLSSKITERAKEFLEDSDVKLEDIITSADTSRKVAERERELAQQAREELDALRSEAEAMRKKHEEEQEKYRKKAKEEARRIVAQAKDESERIIRELRRVKTADQSSVERAIQNSRDSLRKQEGEYAEQLMQAQDDGKPLTHVEVGQTVKVLSLDNEGKVLTLPDSRGNVQVRVGIMKMTVPLSDLRYARESTKLKNAGGTKPKRKSVSLELDIRGNMVDEAIPIVDLYLDDASAAGLSEVSIIHGKGTGALRAGIQAHLRHHKRVESFRMGSYGQGDAGVTVVTLKK
ncbi:MAG: endonuclease MutS2 [Clostridia bacterium]|nr:endonuclease MutS2 [Clostridia bacterium]